MIDTWLLYAWAGAGLMGLGLYGFIAHAHLLRRIVCFNVMGSGLFLFFGALARRVPDAGVDPVPQALIITGIVVALSLTAVAVALMARWVALRGCALLPEEDPAPHEDPPP